MGGMFDSLTKSGVSFGPSEPVRYYDSPAAAEANSVRSTNVASPSVDVGGGALTLPATNSTVSNPGKVVKPSFNQAIHDQYGNIKSDNAGLTKGGALMKLLLAGAEGAAAGAGAQNFSEGFKQAQALPFQRARMVQEQQQNELQNQVLQEQVNNIPFIRQQRIAQAKRENYINTPNGLYDVSTGQIVDGTTKDAKDSPQDQRIQFVKEHPELFKTDAERQNYALYGTRPPESTPHTIQTAQGVMQFNPQTNAYDIKVGDLPKTVPAAVNINQKNASEDDYNYIANQLLDPYNLTALKDVAGRGGKERAHIFAVTSKLAQQNGVSFDPGVIDRRIKFIDSYEDPKGRAAINRQAINNIMQHGADLLDLNNEYRRADVRVLNTPLNAIARQFGNDAYIKFQTVNGVLKDELALYFAGGYAPTSDQKAMWDKIQADEATPAQTEAFAREVARLALRRANTFNSQFKSMMGYDDPNMFSPEARDAAVKLGVGKEVNTFGVGGQIGKKPAAKSGDRPPLSTFER